MPKALRTVPADCSCAYVAPELRYKSQICSACARHYGVDRVTPEHWSRRLKAILKERAEADAKRADEEDSGDAYDRVQLELDQAHERIKSLTRLNKRLEQELREATFLIYAAAHYATHNSP